MAFHLHEQEDGVLAEINMTPLVDVLLVLLIIFMVAMPLMARQIEVDLPVAASATKQNEATQLSVVIGRDGIVRVNEQTMKVTAVKAHFSALRQGDHNLSITLAADQQVPYGKVMQVMDAARMAGVSKLNFVTQGKGND